MICAYIDESGNSGSDLTDPNQPLHFVGAVLVPEDKWDATQHALLKIRKEAIDLGADRQSFEFHGKDMFRGEKCWETVAFHDRMNLYRQCIAVLKSEDLDIVYGCCDKRRMQRYSDPMHPQSVAFWLCLERIAQCAHANGCKAMMVADDTSPSLRKLTRAVLSNYRKSGPPFGPRVDLTCLIDTVHFLESQESMHMQLIDMALFVAQRKILGRSTTAFGEAVDIIFDQIVDCRRFPY